MKSEESNRLRMIWGVIPVTSTLHGQTSDGPHVGTVDGKDFYCTTRSGDTP
jgi:hypothetical protein